MLPDLTMHFKSTNKLTESICLVHFNKTPGGIEVLLPGIVRAFSERVFNVFVIRPSDGLSVYENINCNVTYGSRINLKAIFKLILFARRNRLSVFHVFNIWPIFLLTLRLAGVRGVVYSIHGTIYWHNWIEKTVLKLIWHLAVDSERHLFTSNSDYSGRVFNEKVYPGIKPILLYNYFDLDRFNHDTLSGRPNNISKIIYAGRLAAGKGLEKWIKTAVEIHRCFPDIGFDIYGSGRLTGPVKQQIEKSGASGYIIIRGHRKDIENAYREADLLLFLSEYESFGNVVVESILCGTPVLVLDIPSMREIFRDFPEFILRTDDSLAEQIRDRLSQIEDLRDLALKARRQFGRRFSMEAHIKTLDEIYRTFDG